MSQNQSTTNLPISNGKLAMWLFLATEIMFFTGMLATCMLLRESARVPGPGIAAWPTPKTVHLEPWIGAINTVILISSSLLALFSIQELRAGNQSKATRFLGATILLGVVFLGIKATEYRSKFEHGLLPGKIGECVGGLTPENEKLLLPNGVAYVRKVQEKLRAITQGVTPENLPAQKEEVKKCHALLQLTLDSKDSKNDYIRPLTPGQLGDKVNELIAQYPQLHLPPAIPNGNLWASCYFALTGIHAIHVICGLVAFLVLFLAGLMGKLQNHFAALELTGLYWHFVDLVWLVIYPILYIL